MKLAASGRYDLALVQMNEALQANRWNKLYYWGSALLTLMVKILHLGTIQHRATYSLKLF